MVISLSRECFDKMINKYPKVTIKILEESFLRIRHAEDLVTRLIENSADVKVASLLLSLARNFGVKKINGILLELNISRENMGSFAGLTRETVTRKLAETKCKRGYRVNRNEKDINKRRWLFKEYYRIEVMKIISFFCGKLKINYFIKQNNSRHSTLQRKSPNTSSRP